MDTIFTIVNILVLVFIVGSIFGLLRHRLITYRFRDSDFQVAAFGLIPIKVITYKSVAEVREINFIDTFRLSAPPLALGNRLTNKCVLVRRSSGLFKNVIVTPDTPEQFVADLKKRIFEVTGRQI